MPQVADLKVLFANLGSDLALRDVSLRCECENFETVYVRLDSKRGLVATDLGETLAYLRRGDDETYLPIDELDLARLAALCAAQGALLNVISDDAIPDAIECLIPGDGVVRTSVTTVAEAIDAVFQAALRSAKRI